jgi:hypothetical protein
MDIADTEGYSPSADSKTMMITSHVSTAAGDIDTKLVFDKPQ